MSRHDPLARLLHMRDFARKALELTQGKSQADLENDEVLRLALTRLVELIRSRLYRRTCLQLQ
jgi:hypothetical protein